MCVYVYTRIKVHDWNSGLSVSMYMSRLRISMERPVRDVEVLYIQELKKSNSSIKLKLEVLVRVWVQAGSM